jgi:predicted PurR-regulated permease PerM
MALRVTQRERRWLDALLILATIAAAFVVVGFLASIFFYLGDIVLVFFLAWLLAFILSPVVGAMERIIPRLPRVVAVVVVYTVLVGSLIVLVVILAQALTTSIAEFIAGVPQLRTDLPTVLAPWQERLNAVGLSQVDLVGQGQAFLDNLNDYAAQLVDPLRQVAVASLGALGNLLIVIILSLYMVIDRERIVSFLFRLVPPAFALEARLLETSIARSFGGFLRGQAAMGIIYGFVGAATGLVFGLGYVPVVAAASGVLMAIPFFGPFVSWLPPVLVAVLLKPDVVLPTLVAMLIGWFVVMNIVQPRLMQEAVGIHPIVVLGSVLIGSKVGGIAGAIFGIPIAAVVSAFFFHFLGRTRESGSVAHRAARRLADREGREVRVPVEPAPGIDPDVDEPRAPMARPVASTTADPRPSTDQ